MKGYPASKNFDEMENEFKKREFNKRSKIYAINKAFDCFENGEWDDNLQIKLQSLTSSKMSYFQFLK